jgi:hypothetical protein
MSVREKCRLVRKSEDRVYLCLGARENRRLAEECERESENRVGYA